MEMILTPQVQPPVGSQDPLHLCLSPFIPFGEIKTQFFLKIINSGGTHLVVGFTTYFFVSISY